MQATDSPESSFRVSLNMQTEPLENRLIHEAAITIGAIQPLALFLYFKIVRLGGLKTSIPIP